MNYTQNEKIKQINENTLIIGIDIAKHTHVARGQDFRGIELDKGLVFNNSEDGFKKLGKWIIKLCSQYNKSNIIVGMEPTGHYWFNLGHYLKDNNVKIVLVNPMHVKRSKELDDNSPTKNDFKDAKVIAQLVKDGRYSEPVIPRGIYAELRLAMDERYEINKNLNSIKNKVKRWLDKYFPEFFKVFKKWEGKAAFMTLKYFPFPNDIRKLGEYDIVSIWKTQIKRAVGIKRAKKLVNTARNSIGIQEGHKMAKRQLDNLLVRYELLIEQLNALENEIEKLVKEIPGAEEMLSVDGVGLITVGGFIAEIGDLDNFNHPKQIIKLAGLNLKENSSGKHKGKTTITKRGRSKLRNVLFKAIMPMVVNNEEFKQLHHYYTTRAINPLRKKQSLIALCSKLIRVLFALGKKKVTYDGDKLLKHIKRPSELQYKVA